jgi:hypothetical protein
MPPDEDFCGDSTAIENGWEILRQRQQRRFDYKIQLFTGHRDLGGTWQNLVFGRFAEAVEVTAVQRGCERWRP